MYRGIVLYLCVQLLFPPQVWQMAFAQLPVTQPTKNEVPKPTSDIHGAAFSGLGIAAAERRKTEQAQLKEDRQNLLITFRQFSWALSQTVRPIEKLMSLRAVENRNLKEPFDQCGDYFGQIPENLHEFDEKITLPVTDAFSKFLNKWGHVINKVYSSPSNEPKASQDKTDVRLTRFISPESKSQCDIREPVLKGFNLDKIQSNLSSELREQNAALQSAYKEILKPITFELEKSIGEDVLTNTEIRRWLTYYAQFLDVRRMMTRFYEKRASNQKPTRFDKLRVNVNVGKKLELIIHEQRAKFLKAKEAEISRGERFLDNYAHFKSCSSLDGNPTGEYCYELGLPNHSLEIQEKFMMEIAGAVAKDADGRTKTDHAVSLSAINQMAWLNREANLISGNRQLPESLRYPYPDACKIDGFDDYKNFYNEGIAASKEEWRLQEVLKVTNRLEEEYRTEADGVVAPRPTSRALYKAGQEIATQWINTIVQQKIAKLPVARNEKENEVFKAEGFDRNAEVKKLTDAREEMLSALQALPFEQRILYGDLNNRQDGHSYTQSLARSIQLFFTLSSESLLPLEGMSVTDRKKRIHEIMKEVAAATLVDALSDYVQGTLTHELASNNLHTELVEWWRSQLHVTWSEILFEKFPEELNKMAAALAKEFEESGALTKSYSPLEDVDDTLTKYARNLRENVREAVFTNDTLDYMSRKLEDASPTGVKSLVPGPWSEGAKRSGKIASNLPPDLQVDDGFGHGLNSGWPLTPPNPTKADGFNQAEGKTYSNDYLQIQDAFFQVATSAKMQEKFIHLLRSRYWNDIKDPAIVKKVFGDEVANVATVANLVYGKLKDLMDAEPETNSGALIHSRQELLKPLLMWLDMPGARAMYDQHRKEIASALFSKHLEAILKNRPAGAPGTPAYDAWKSSLTKTFDALLKDEVQIYERGKESEMVDKVIAVYQTHLDRQNNADTLEKTDDKAKGMREMFQSARRAGIQQRIFSSPEYWKNFCLGPNPGSAAVTGPTIFAKLNLNWIDQRQCKAWIQNNARPFQPLPEEDATLRKIFRERVASNTERLLIQVLEIFSSSDIKQLSNPKNTKDSAKATFLADIKKAILIAWTGPELNDYSTAEQKAKFKEIQTGLDAFLVKVTENSDALSLTNELAETVLFTARQSLDQTIDKLGLYEFWQKNLGQNVTSILAAVDSKNEKEILKAFPIVQDVFQRDYGLMIRFQSNTPELSQAMFEKALGDVLMPDFSDFKLVIKDRLHDALEPQADPVKKIKQLEDSIRSLRDENFAVTQEHNKRRFLKRALDTLILKKAPQIETLRTLNTASRVIEIHRQRAQAYEDVKHYIRMYVPKTPFLAGLQQLDQASRDADTRIREAYFGDLFLNSTRDASGKDIQVKYQKKPYFVTMADTLDMFNFTGQALNPLVQVDYQTGREYLEDMQKYCDAAMSDEFKNTFGNAYKQTLENDLATINEAENAKYAASFLAFAPTPGAGVLGSLTNTAAATHLTSEMGPTKRLKRLWIWNRQAAKKDLKETELERQFGQWFKNNLEPALNSKEAIAAVLWKEDSGVPGADTFCRLARESAARLIPEFKKAEAQKKIDDLEKTDTDPKLAYSKRLPHSHLEDYWKTIWTTSSVFSNPKKEIGALVRSATDITWFRHAPVGDLAPLEFKPSPEYQKAKQILGVDGGGKKRKNLLQNDLLPSRALLQLCASPALTQEKFQDLLKDVQYAGNPIPVPDLEKSRRCKTWIPQLSAGQLSALYDGIAEKLDENLKASGWEQLSLFAPTEKDRQTYAGWHQRFRKLLLMWDKFFAQIPTQENSPILTKLGSAIAGEFLGIAPFKLTVTEEGIPTLDYSDAKVERDVALATFLKLAPKAKFAVIKDIQAAYNHEYNRTLRRSQIAWNTRQERRFDLNLDTESAPEIFETLPFKDAVVQRINDEGLTRQSTAMESTFDYYLAHFITDSDDKSSLAPGVPLLDWQVYYEVHSSFADNYPRDRSALFSLNWDWNGRKGNKAELFQSWVSTISAHPDAQELFDFYKNEMAEERPYWKKFATLSDFVKDPAFEQVRGLIELHDKNSEGSFSTKTVGMFFGSAHYATARNSIKVPTLSDKVQAPVGLSDEHINYLLKDLLVDVLELDFRHPESWSRPFYIINKDVKSWSWIAETKLPGSVREAVTTSDAARNPDYSTGYRAWKTIAEARMVHLVEAEDRGLLATRVGSVQVKNPYGNTEYNYRPVMENRDDLVESKGYRAALTHNSDKPTETPLFKHLMTIELSPIGEVELMGMKKALAEGKQYTRENFAKHIGKFSGHHFGKDPALENKGEKPAAMDKISTIIPAERIDKVIRDADTTGITLPANEREKRNFIQKSLERETARADILATLSEVQYAYTNLERGFVDTLVEIHDSPKFTGHLDTKRIQHGFSDFDLKKEIETALNAYAGHSSVPKPDFDSLVVFDNHAATRERWVGAAKKWIDTVTDEEMLAGHDKSEHKNLISLRDVIQRIYKEEAYKIGLQFGIYKATGEAQKELSNLCAKQKAYEKIHSDADFDRNHDLLYESIAKYERIISLFRQSDIIPDTHKEMAENTSQRLMELAREKTLKEKQLEVEEELLNTAFIGGTALAALVITRGPAAKQFISRLGLGRSLSVARLSQTNLLRRAAASTRLKSLATGTAVSGFGLWYADIERRKLAHDLWGKEDELEEDLRIAGGRVNSEGLVEHKTAMMYRRGIRGVREERRDLLEWAWRMWGLLIIGEFATPLVRAGWSGVREMAYFISTRKVFGGKRDLKGLKTHMAALNKDLEGQTAKATLDQMDDAEPARLATAAYRKLSAGEVSSTTSTGIPVADDRLRKELITIADHQLERHSTELECNLHRETLEDAIALTEKRMARLDPVKDHSEINRLKQLNELRRNAGAQVNSIRSALIKLRGPGSRVELEMMEFFYLTPNDLLAENLTPFWTKLFFPTIYRTWTNTKFNGTLRSAAKMRRIHEALSKIASLKNDRANISMALLGLSHVDKQLLSFDMLFNDVSTPFRDYFGPSLLQAPRDLDRKLRKLADVVWKEAGKRAQLMGGLTNLSKAETKLLQQERFRELFMDALEKAPAKVTPVNGSETLKPFRALNPGDDEIINAANKLLWDEKNVYDRLTLRSFGHRFMEQYGLETEAETKKLAEAWLEIDTWIENAMPIIKSFARSQKMAPSEVLQAMLGTLSEKHPKFVWSRVFRVNGLAEQHAAQELGLIRQTISNDDVRLLQNHAQNLREIVARRHLPADHKLLEAMVSESPGKMGEALARYTLRRTADESAMSRAKTDVTAITAEDQKSRQFLQDLFSRPPASRGTNQSVNAVKDPWNFINEQWKLYRGIYDEGIRTSVYKGPLSPFVGDNAAFEAWLQLADSAVTSGEMEVRTMAREILAHQLPATILAEEYTKFMLLREGAPVPDAIRQAFEIAHYITRLAEYSALLEGDTRKVFIKLITNAVTLRAHPQAAEQAANLLQIPLSHGIPLADQQKTARIFADLFSPNEALNVSELLGISSAKTEREVTDRTRSLIEALEKINRSSVVASGISELAARAHARVVKAEAAELARIRPVAIVPPRLPIPPPTVEKKTTEEAAKPVEWTKDPLNNLTVRQIHWEKIVAGENSAIVREAEQMGLNEYKKFVEKGLAEGTFSINGSEIRVLRFTERRANARAMVDGGYWSEAEAKAYLTNYLEVQHKIRFNMSKEEATEMVFGFYSKYFRGETAYVTSRESLKTLPPVEQFIEDLYFALSKNDALLASEIEITNALRSAERLRAGLLGGELYQGPQRMLLNTQLSLEEILHAPYSRTLYEKVLQKAKLKSDEIEFILDVLRESPWAGESVAHRHLIAIEMQDHLFWIAFNVEQSQIAATRKNLAGCFFNEYTQDELTRTLAIIRKLFTTGTGPNVSSLVGLDALEELRATSKAIDALLHRSHGLVESRYRYDMANAIRKEGMGSLRGNTIQRLRQSALALAEQQNRLELGYLSDLMITMGDTEAAGILTGANTDKKHLAELFKRPHMHESEIEQRMTLLKKMIEEGNTERAKSLIYRGALIPWDFSKAKINRKSSFIPMIESHYPLILDWETKKIAK